MFGLPSFPAMEAMFTTRPYLRLRMWVITALVQMDHAHQIDADDLVPVLFGLLPKRGRLAGDAGVVHKNVDLPLARDELRRWRRPTDSDRAISI